jgi:hypothetical protein
MKKTIITIVLFHLLVTAALAQSNFMGRWVGTWGVGNLDEPCYYSFLFNSNNTLQLINNYGQVIASGTFNAIGSRFNANYTYLWGHNFSVAGTIAAGTLSGTWGSGSNNSGGGRWVMRRLVCVGANGTTFLPGQLEPITCGCNGLQTRTCQTDGSWVNTPGCILKPGNAGDMCFSPEKGYCCVCPAGTTCKRRISKRCSGWWIFRNCIKVSTVEWYCDPD